MPIPPTLHRLSRMVRLYAPGTSRPAASTGMLVDAYAGSGERSGAETSLEPGGIQDDVLHPLASPRVGDMDQSVTGLDQRGV